MCIGVALCVLAGCTSAPKPNAGLQTDAQFSQRVEQQIQQCVRDKVASAEQCRNSAYATALAAGFPPEEAAHLTGYRRK